MLGDGSLTLTAVQPVPDGREGAGDAAWMRPALIALLALTPVLYLWDLGASGWANAYYSAAAQAGWQDWVAMLFGSFDPSNAITAGLPQRQPGAVGFGGTGPPGGFAPGQGQFGPPGFGARAGGGFPGNGNGDGGAGGLLNAGQTSPDLVAALQAGADGFRWVAADTGSNNAARLALSSGESVLSIGGFNGTDPSPTLAQFRAWVAAGEIHYYVAGQDAGGFRGAVGGSQAAAAIDEWVTQTFEPVVIGGVTVYDLADSAGA